MTNICRGAERALRKGACLPHLGQGAGRAAALNTRCDLGLPKERRKEVSSRHKEARFRDSEQLSLSDEK